MDFTISSDFRLKMKESEKIAKYLDLALRNMKAIIKQIVVGVFGTIIKNLKRNSKNWRLDKELKPSHNQNWFGYLGESRKFKEPCFRSEPSENLSIISWRPKSRATRKLPFQ